MVQLLSCARGHYWEAPADDKGASPSATHCPVCAAPADNLPLLDFAPSATEPHTPPPVLAEVPLRDENGLPLVAGYEVLELLGRSPKGVGLYRARQRIGGRPVLLEVVVAREDPSQQAWGSLRGEAAALGRLHHPNIVQLCEAGERDRQLFYNAIEWVEGPTLADFLREQRPSVPEAMALVEVLARAMHQAHEKGLVHRCLKPASILLQPLDPVPLPRCSIPPPPVCRLGGKLFLPRITHFGQARRPLEGEVADMDLQGGLPFYLAPEQAWGRARDIGPATDIHALGAILYELAAGKPPFPGETPLAVLERIQGRDAPSLEQHRTRLMPGLSALCRKCLAKSPRRRYASALELADDLRRCAGGYPISTATLSLFRRALMALGRHRYACVLLLMAAVTGLSLRSALRSDRSENAGKHSAVSTAGPSPVLSSELVQLREREQRLLYFHTIGQVDRVLRAGDTSLARTLLDSCSPPLRGWEWNYLSRQQQRIPALPDRRTTWPIRALAVNSEGDYMAAGCGSDGGPGKEAQGEVQVFRVDVLPVPLLRCRWTNFAGPVHGLGFHAEDKQLAILSSAGQPESGSRIELRTPGMDRVTFQQTMKGPPLTSLAVLPEPQLLAVCGPESQLRYLDMTHDLVKEETVNPAHSEAGTLLCPVPPQTGLCRIILVGSSGRDLSLYSPWEPFPAHIQRPHSDPILALAWGRSIQRLATASADHTICLGTLSLNQSMQTLRGHIGPVTSVAFSPDNKRLASTSRDGTIKLWDTETGLEVLSLPGYTTATAIAFVPPGHLLVVAHENRLTFLNALPP